MQVQHIIVKIQCSVAFYYWIYTVLIPQAKLRSILRSSFAAGLTAKKNAARGEMFQIMPMYTWKLHHVNIVDNKIP